MKKSNKPAKLLIAGLLIISLLLTTVISTGAVVYRPGRNGMPYGFVPWKYTPATLDGEHTGSEKLRELRIYCENVCVYFMLSTEWSEWPGNDGDVEAEYTPDTMTELASVLNNIYDSVEQYLRDGAVPEDDFDFQACYDAVIAASQKVEMRESAIADLVEFCEAENNDKGFYAPAVWEPFTAALQNARSACTDNISAGNTEAFWSLYFAYNRLCNQYGEAGDIDGDGLMTITDVSVLQWSLAKMRAPLNAAQRCAGCVKQRYSGDDYIPDITDGTTIQRRLAKMNVMISDNKIAEEDIETESWDINPILYSKLYSRWSLYPYDEY